MAEPITAVTDFAIALETALFVVLLLHFSRIEQLWAVAFACVSLAACLGGIYHGFAAVLDLPGQRLLWYVLAYAVGSASFFMVVATAQSTVRPAFQRPVTLMALGKLLVYLIAITLRLDFASVVADYLLAMVFVFLLQLAGGLPRKQPGAPWIMAGVALSILAVGILAWPWAGIAMFQPVDIYHLVQMVALSFFYLGVWLNVPDAPSPLPK